MKKKRNFTILNARFTATVSVGLVLLILGVVGLTAIAASEITREIKENLGFDIVLKEDVSESSVNSLYNSISSSPYCSSAQIHTSEEAMRDWEESTGENVIEIVGVNPFATEIDVKVSVGYALSDSIEALAERYRHIDIVDEVTIHSDMVDQINSNMRRGVIVLSVIAVALLLISLVLINNTIRLTVYSRRFIIHTMKLVGATAGFIRRPFIKSNIINGLIAGVFASLILMGLVAYGENIDPSIANALPAWRAAVVYVALPVIGMLICGAGALFATNRYLRITYDDLFD